MCVFVCVRLFVRVRVRVCVCVQELKFTFEIIKLKGYFEAFFEQPPPFTLSLKETTTDETVWSATIREGNPSTCLERLSSFWWL